MIELSPSYDSAIVVLENGVSIRFAGIPEAQVANDLYDLVRRYKGITMPDDYQDGDLAEFVGRPDHQRLYYWLTISPVFEVEKVANSIAACLNKHYKLSVRLVFISVSDEPDRVVVLQSTKEG